MGSKNGLVFSKTAWSPPTIKVRVPPLAPGVEPVQGASRKSTPLAFKRLSDLAARAGADGAGIGYHRSGPRAVDDAVGSQDDLLRHGGIADAEEDAVGVLGHLRGVYRRSVPFSSAASLRALSEVLDHSATSWPARKRLRAIG